MVSPSIINPIMRNEMNPVLLDLFAHSGYPPLDEMLINALPIAGYDPSSYVLRAAPATGLLNEDDVVDLGIDNSASCMCRVTRPAALRFLMKNPVFCSRAMRFMMGCSFMTALV